MLLAVMLVGQSALGAQRWISIGPISIQPSEFSKLIMIVCLASVLEERVGKLNTLDDLLPVGNGLEIHLDPAQRQSIVDGDGCHIGARAIDEHTAAGADVRNGPAAVVITGQDGMRPGNGRHVDDQIAPFAAADDVLPMGHRQACSVRQTEPRPDLLSGRHCQEFKLQR